MSTSMYFRKWTRMSWYESVRLFRKYNMIKYDDKQRALHLFPFPEIYDKEYEQHKAKQPIKLSKQEKQEKDQEQSLVSSLLLKYPDLKYEPLQKVYSKNEFRTSNYLVRFIERQKQLMKQGYTEQKAFELTERQFQERIQRKIDQTRITESLALTNEARSFMNYYQQQSEYESRLKVIRMNRDVERYRQELSRLEEQSQRENEEEEEEEDGELLSEIDKEIELNQKEGRAIYQKVLHKFVNQGDPEAPRPRDEGGRAQMVNEFILRTNHMFQFYYERAATNDKLDGLTDLDIKFQVRNTPKKIEKKTRALLVKLNNLGVVLREDGQIDFSSVKNDNLRTKLQNNPQIRYALIQQELNFESPIAEMYKQKALEYKRRLQEIEELQEQHQEQMKKERRPELEKFSGIDPKESFRLIETYEQRALRLESLLLKSRIRELDDHLDQQQVQKEWSSQLEETIKKFRRLKYRLEQQNLLRATDMIFQEHLVFDKSELEVDLDVPYEDLEEYLKKPAEQRRSSESLELSDNLINKMIQRSTIYEDLVEPFTINEQNILTEQDSIDFDRRKYRDQKQQERRDQQMSELIAQEQKNSTIITSDPSESQKPESVAQDTSKTGKSEKKKLVEFIEKANMKAKSTSILGTMQQKKKQLEKAKQEALKKKGKK